MKSIDIQKSKTPLAEVVAAAGKGVVVLRSGRRPVAAVISLETVDRESLALSTDPGFLAIIEQGRAEIRTGKTLSFGEMKKAVLR
jgi:PHD/YefM family antitoxin component YafN of YafNO toxin-antitoxin module